MTRWLAPLLLSLVACGGSTAADAGADLPSPLDLAPAVDGGPDPLCHVIEVRLAVAAKGLQLAAWLEDAKGHFVDTLAVTRTTAQFGLGNRPGAATLKTDFGWPYGRREMVMPVWAHRRNHHYPLVVMGGICGHRATDLCPDGTPCGAECDDNSIALHDRISSPEPFYCSPSGAMLDAMTCASRGTFAKGDLDGTSLYPPRSDLVQCYATDSPRACALMTKPNDLDGVSQATPPVGVTVPIFWAPAAGAIPDGDYEVWVEMSQEADFNAAHHHPQQIDDRPTSQSFGHDFLGQPSMVYVAPVHLGGAGSSSSFTWAGYGSWDGSDGNLRPPDATITVGTPGTGAGRLQQLDVRSGRCE